MDAECNTDGVNLASILTRRQFHHATDISVSACCTDHRRCREGDLYVALMRPDQDGHEFVADALNQGAKAVLTERLLPLEVPQCVVPDTKIAHAALCQHLAGNPGRQIPILGVAGNRRRTAATAVLTGILQRIGQQPAFFAANAVSDGFSVASRETAGSATAPYARWLANALAHECSHAVTELSQNEVAEHAFSSVPVRCLLLTDLESNTHRNACSPKTEVYLRRTLAQVPRDGLVVVNTDCDVLRNVVRAIDHPTLTISADSQADISANPLESFPSEQTFLLDAGEETAVARTKIIGKPFIRDSLLAIAACVGLGYDLREILAAFESIDSIPGYLERIECGQRFSVFADAARDPIDLRQTLNTLRNVTRGRLICLFGQGPDPNRMLRSLRGRTVERFADLGVITNDDTLDESPLAAAHDILDGYRDPSKAHLMPNRQHAIEWTLNQAQPGDTVVLAGAQNDLPSTSVPRDVDIAKHCLLELAKPSNLDWLIARR